MSARECVCVCAFIRVCRVFLAAWTSLDLGVRRTGAYRELLLVVLPPGSVHAPKLLASLAFVHILFACLSIGRHTYA